LPDIEIGATILSENDFHSHAIRETRDQNWNSKGECLAMPWVKKEDCIGCGLCVDECRAGAIFNIEWTLQLLKHYETEEDREGFIERIRKHFAKERTVIEETLARIEALEI